MQLAFFTKRKVDALEELTWVSGLNLYQKLYLKTLFPKWLTMFFILIGIKKNNYLHVIITFELETAIT